MASPHSNIRRRRTLIDPIADASMGSEPNCDHTSISYGFDWKNNPRLEATLHCLNTDYRFNDIEIARILNSVYPVEAEAPTCIAPICPAFVRYLRSHSDFIAERDQSAAKTTKGLEEKAGYGKRRKAWLARPEAYTAEAWWLAIKDQIAFAAWKLCIAVREERSDTTRLRKAFQDHRPGGASNAAQYEKDTAWIQDRDGDGEYSDDEEEVIVRFPPSTAGYVARHPDLPWVARDDGLFELNWKSESREKLSQRAQFSWMRPQQPVPPSSPRPTTRNGDVQMVDVGDEEAVSSTPQRRSARLKTKTTKLPNHVQELVNGLPNGEETAPPKTRELRPRQKPNALSSLLAENSEEPSKKLGRDRPAVMEPQIQDTPTPTAGSLQLPERTGNMGMNAPPPNPHPPQTYYNPMYAPIAGAYVNFGANLGPPNPYASMASNQQMYPPYFPTVPTFAGPPPQPSSINYRSPGFSYSNGQPLHPSLPALPSQTFPQPHHQHAYGYGPARRLFSPPPPNNGYDFGPTMPQYGTGMTYRSPMYPRLMPPAPAPPPRTISPQPQLQQPAMVQSVRPRTAEIQPASLVPHTIAPAKMLRSPTGTVPFVHFSEPQRQTEHLFLRIVHDEGACYLNAAGEQVTNWMDRLERSACGQYFNITFRDGEQATMPVNPEQTDLQRVPAKNGIDRRPFAYRSRFLTTSPIPINILHSLVTDHSGAAPLMHLKVMKDAGPPGHQRAQIRERSMGYPSDARKYGLFGPLVNKAYMRLFPKQPFVYRGKGVWQAVKSKLKSSPKGVSGLHPPREDAAQDVSNKKRRRIVVAVEGLQRRETEQDE